MFTSGVIDIDITISSSYSPLPNAQLTLCIESHLHPVTVTGGHTHCCWSRPATKQKEKKGKTRKEDNKIRRKNNLVPPAKGVQAASGANVDEGAQLDIWWQFWVLSESSISTLTFKPIAPFLACHKQHC